LDLPANARRVLFFYTFLFKVPPILVIRISGRQASQRNPQLVAAVRSLVDDFGLRVVVDGCSNSVPPELLAISRDTAITLDELSPLLTDSIRELKDFFELLSYHRFHMLHYQIWWILGGSLARYFELQETLAEINDESAEVIIQKLDNYVRSALFDALRECDNSSANTKKLIRMFTMSGAIRISVKELASVGYSLDYPNKVFREVKIGSSWFIQPATSTISVIISENIDDGDGVDELTERLVFI
jgi:hypothetical protein